MKKSKKTKEKFMPDVVEIRTDIKVAVFIVSFAVYGRVFLKELYFRKMKIIFISHNILGSSKL